MYRMYGRIELKIIKIFYFLPEFSYKYNLYNKDTILSEYLVNRLFQVRLIILYRVMSSFNKGILPWSPHLCI